jgi:tetratricopeptide (TPR) repeat protein
MLKRLVPTVAHTALTNHRSVRTVESRTPMLLTPIPQATPRGLIRVSPAPEPNHKPVPDVVLLQAYRGLLLKAPWLRPRYSALLDRLRGDEPDNPIVLAAAGHEQLLPWTPAAIEQAVVLLRKALTLGDFDVRMDLADALAGRRRFDEASGVLKEGLSHDPYEPKLRKSLIALSMKAGNYAEAIRIMDTYLRLLSG